MASPSGGFDLVPSNRELAGAEIELVDLPERETRLKDALAEALSQIAHSHLRESRTTTTLHPARLPALALAAHAQRLRLAPPTACCIPMQCEYYALEGLSDLRCRRDPPVART